MSLKEKYEIQPIGVIHSCFSEKFGIPRQPGLAPHAVAELELLPPFAREEMVRELERFSHIWVSFIFHEIVEEGWRTTIRPPWLGGQKRVGVLASRSPHRPNFIGMSVVKLQGIRNDCKGLILDISGVDMLDQTPVVDLRPYIPYSDSIPEAGAGYTGLGQIDYQVVFSEDAEKFCRDYWEATGRNLYGLLEDVVGQDPRPASQRDDGREFGVLLWDVNCRFVYRDEVAEILSCEKQ